MDTQHYLPKLRFPPIDWRDLSRETQDVLLEDSRIMDSASTDFSAWSALNVVEPAPVPMDSTCSKSKASSAHASAV